MSPSQRGWLIALIVLLGLAEVGWQMHASVLHIKQNIRLTRDSHPYAHPAKDAKPGEFGADEVRNFLAAARQAETFNDPMQRCLAYPDPPHSHWSHVAAAAYCRYHFNVVLSLPEMQVLIQGGHAAELDRRLAQALQEQQSKPESAGLLDRIYYASFNSGSANVRPLLDAWKQASPHSAFAYAASGFDYVARASEARGTDYVRDTPPSQMDAMKNLLAKADEDLKRAVALDPKVTPAYVALINADRMGDTSDAASAFEQGIAAAPADYSIYSAYLTALQPRWGGSLQRMARVIDSAQAHAGENPLLQLLPAEELAEDYDVCDCHSRADWLMDPVVFDNVAGSNLLERAGDAASTHNYPGLAVVYLSEALRFDPNLWRGRASRDYALTMLGEPDWAIQDANHLIDIAPKYAEGYNVRAYAYEAQHDYAHAAQDLVTATSLKRDDSWGLIELGNLYAHKTHEWDKGWDVADRLIRFYPEKPQGWLIRASIQKDQPRAGLDDTIHYFLAHFGGDPRQHVAVAEMRATLAREAAARTASTSAPHG